MQAGFLKKDTPVEPIPSDALEVKLDECLAACAELRAKPASEEEPYVFRYEEREQLTQLLKQAKANAAAEAGTAIAAAAPRARAIGGVLECWIGINFMDTEELGPAQGRLEAAIEALGDAPAEGVRLIDALNHLGILWANRGESEKALEHLIRAEALHRELASGGENGKAAAALREGEQLADLHTLTCFYLAQAYGGLGQRDHSAAYCHVTMQRQLARRGTAARGEHAFEPHEWAKNAQQIAAYYTSCNRFDWAEHCLRAAGAVLAAERKRTAGAPRAAESDTAKTRTYFGGKQQWKTVDVDEVNAAAAAPAAAAPAAAAPAAAAPAAAPAATSSSLSDSDKEEAARLDLSWAQLYSDLLSRASALKAQRQGGKAAPPPEGEPFGASHKLCFGALGLDPPSARCADPGIVTDYEAAKEVFKLGSAYVLRAKGFLVLDGFVTDHFAALNLETGLYQLLAAWEPDFARRLTMHKRRLELLKAVELINETAYLQISRQARFDMGSIAADILELKAAIHADDPPARQDKKLAGPVEAVVELYDKFIAGFAKDGALPTQVEEGSEHAYLQAHFHKARAQGKLHGAESLRGSLASYQVMVAYFDANKVEGMDDEAQICREMAELLPRRIDMASKAQS